MKTLSLVIDDVDAELCPDLLAKMQAAVRRVRTTEGGWIIAKGRSEKHGPMDWRFIYERFLQRQFPQAWIYRGGHHVTVHASPPAEPKQFGRGPQGEAGRVLFRIIEIKP